jgi:hypothetical protein
MRNAQTAATRARTAPCMLRRFSYALRACVMLTRNADEKCLRVMLTMRVMRMRNVSITHGAVRARLAAVFLVSITSRLAYRPTGR